MGDRARGKPGGGGHDVLSCQGAIQASSKSASTSVATPSGRAATPTAERAWRPFSPKTSTIRSEAPLTTFGWSVKAGAEFDEAGELDDPRDAAEIAGRGLGLGEHVDGAQAGGLLAVLDRQVFAAAALEEIAGTVCRKLPRNKEMQAADHVGHVVGGGRGRGRQDNAEVSEPFFDRTGHGSLPMEGGRRATRGRQWRNLRGAATGLSFSFLRA